MNLIASQAERALARIQSNRRQANVIRHLSSMGPAAPKGWEAFAGLIPASVALVGMVERNVEPRVNLLLPDLRRSSMFAGIRTALVVGAAVANQLGVSLRIIHFGSGTGRSQLGDAEALVCETTGMEANRLSVVSGWELGDRCFSSRDVWIPTYWATAHAVQVARDLGLVDEDRVLYLIQDYEPEFFAGSTQAELARSTYHANFVPLVNSEPLAKYLHWREGIVIDSAAVFRPEIDVDQARRAFAARTSQRHRVNIAYYARPSKPRNAFDLGVSALRLASARLQTMTTTVNFESVGERHPDLHLNGPHRLTSLGKLPWNGYFDFLARTDVLLSLQMTPHPSHPPIDAVLSGALAVTNEFQGTRAALTDRITAAAPGPTELASALVAAVERSLDEPKPSEFDDNLMPRLGNHLGAVIDYVAGQGKLS